MKNDAYVAYSGYSTEQIHDQSMKHKLRNMIVEAGLMQELNEQISEDSASAEALKADVDAVDVDDRTSVLQTTTPSPVMFHPQAAAASDTAGNRSIRKAIIHNITQESNAEDTHLLDKKV